MVGDVIARPFRSSGRRSNLCGGEGTPAPPRLPSRPDFIGTPRNDKGKDSLVLANQRAPGSVSAEAGVWLEPSGVSA